MRALRFGDRAQLVAYHEALKNGNRPDTEIMYAVKKLSEQVIQNNKTESDLFRSLKIQRFSSEKNRQSRYRQ